MRESSLKVKDIFARKKKRKRFFLEPDTKHFCFAVERDSTLSVVYLHARVDIGRETLREAGRGKARRTVQPAKRNRAKERKREGDYWNIYWKVGFPRLRPGDSGGGREEEDREERGAASTSRGAQNERSRRLS